MAICIMRFLLGAAVLSVGLGVVPSALGYPLGPGLGLLVGMVLSVPLVAWAFR